MLVVAARCWWSELTAVEIHSVVEGECDCGAPRKAGLAYTCRHYFECDWGVLRNPEADPRRGIDQLVLTGYDYVRQLLEHGPRRRPGFGGAVTSATDSQARLFIHLDHSGTRWTWELFDAYFADGKTPTNLLIGRWPD